MAHHAGDEPGFLKSLVLGTAQRVDRVGDSGKADVIRNADGVPRLVELLVIDVGFRPRRELVRLPAPFDLCTYPPHAVVDGSLHLLIRSGNIHMQRPIVLAANLTQHVRDGYLALAVTFPLP